MGHTAVLCGKFLHFCASGIDIWGSRKNYYNGISIFYMYTRKKEDENLLTPAAADFWILAGDLTMMNENCRGEK